MYSYIHNRQLINTHNIGWAHAPPAGMHRRHVYGARIYLRRLIELLNIKGQPDEAMHQKQH